MAMGLRTEGCYVTEETKKKLVDHSDDLSKFGIQLEQREVLEKDAGTRLAALALVITCADSLQHGVLRQLVLYLRDKVLLPEDEILRLRLGEPEEVLTYCRMDKETGLQGLDGRH
jgi:hypothetical protein